MAKSLLLISSQTDDHSFAVKLASALKLKLRVMTDPPEVRKFMLANPDSVILWDASRTQGAKEMSDTILCSQDSSRVFAITDKSIQNSQHVLEYPCFGHHWMRRYDPPSFEILSRCVSAAIGEKPFGILRFFPKDSPSQKIQLTRSGQRFAATQAVENFLKLNQVPGKLASTAATCSDELLLNAIYAAPPIFQKDRDAQRIDKSVDFELSEKQYVSLEIASCAEYLGMSVTDQFGSLRKKSLFELLRAPSSARDEALGLRALMNTGLSFVFVATPGKKTEVMVFFVRAGSFKTFQSSFRFISIFTD